MVGEHGPRGANSPTYVHSVLALLYPRSAEAIIYVGSLFFFSSFFSVLASDFVVYYSLIYIIWVGALAPDKEQEQAHSFHRIGTHTKLCRLQNARREARAFLENSHYTGAENHYFGTCR